MSEQFEIRVERPGDEVAREALLDRAVGPIRFRRSSQRLRDGRIAAPGLSFVATCGDEIVGTVRLWNVRACGLGNAVLLGPLAVGGEVQGRGIGSALMRRSVDQAGLLGKDAVVLVGDAPYYSRFGFSAHAARRLAMPGPFERHRLLALALAPGALDHAHGTLRPAGVALQALVPAPLAA